VDSLLQQWKTPDKIKKTDSPRNKDSVLISLFFKLSIFIDTLQLGVLFFY